MFEDLEISQSEKFEIICKRLEETGYKNKLSKKDFDALCKKIMGMSTLELAEIGYNAIKKERAENA
jgi:hypothetical protein